jgi:hypothetical protein
VEDLRVDFCQLAQFAVSHYHLAARGLPALIHKHSCVHSTWHIASFLTADLTSGSFNTIRNLSAILQIDDPGPAAITNSDNTQAVQFVRVDQTDPLAVVQDCHNRMSSRAQHVAAFMI